MEALTRSQSWPTMAPNRGVAYRATAEASVGSAPAIVMRAPAAVEQRLTVPGPAAPSRPPRPQPRRAANCTIAVLQTTVAGSMVGLAVSSFFLPHLPTVAAGIVCATTLGAAAWQVVSAHERFAWWCNHGTTFKHNHFTYRHPGSFSDAALQRHYAAEVARRGTFAGFIEVDALGRILGMPIELYDPLERRPRRYRHIVTLGAVDASPGTPTVRVVFRRVGHFRALMRQSTDSGAVWSEVDAGGGGDCLFHSVRYALLAQNLACGHASAGQLRRLTASLLATDLAYQERICNQACNALHEYASTHRFVK